MRHRTHDLTQEAFREADPEVFLHVATDGVEAMAILCACQKLDPTMLMMKSAKDRLSNKLAEPVDRPMVRRIFVQGQMCSAFVVIAGVGRKDPAQMALAEDDGMIEALPADRADQSLRVPVLPG